MSRDDVPYHVPVLTDQIVAALAAIDPRIVLDAVHVPDETGAGVANVEAVVASIPGSPSDIGGLLGQSFLRHFHVTIDAERGVMHLQSAGAAAGISR